MKFFKHGDGVAVVLPEPLQKASQVKEGDEYEFFQIEPGVFLLLSKARIEESSKREALEKLARKVLPSPAASPANPQSFAQASAVPLSPAGVSKQVASSPVQPPSASQPR